MLHPQLLQGSLRGLQLLMQGGIVATQGHRLCRALDEGRFGVGRCVADDQLDTQVHHFMLCCVFIHAELHAA